MPIAPPISISALYPELLLLVAGCVVLLLGQSGRDSLRRLAPWATLAALVGAIVCVMLGPRVAEWWTAARQTGNGLSFGTISLFVRISALELGILLTLVNWYESREEERGEFLSMMLFSLTGLLLVGPADNLLVLFLTLELVSIPTYIMVVLSRTNVRSVEAGTKYFYLGAVSAAIMAYGFSFLYGVSGTMSLTGAVEGVLAALARPGSLEFGFATVGIVLSIGGLLFKLAAVPMHFYIADAYHGAASPVAGLLGFVPKLAGVVALFKIVLLTGYWPGGEASVFWLLWVVAVASMTIGNFLALRQTNIKRMLAYSGIAHAGYMLVGVVAGPLSANGELAYGVMGDGTAAVLYYVVVYGIANLGAFAVLGLLRVRGGACETLRDVAGLLGQQPALALLLVLAMFTLMGLPPTPGFWGKLSLFGSALTAASTTQIDGRSAWLIALVIIAVLNSAVAAAYYLRVIAAVLLYENEHPATEVPREAQRTGALLCGFLLIIFALYPSGLLSAGQDAATELHDVVDEIRLPQSEFAHEADVVDAVDGNEIPELVEVSAAALQRIRQ